MKTAAVWGLTAVMAAAGLFFYMNAPGRKEDSAVLERSRQYVQTLGARPLAELSLEQKLVLLHAYSNLKKDRETLQVAESSLFAIEALPLERRKVFIPMIAEAYERRGQEEKAALLREKIKV